MKFGLNIDAVFGHGLMIFFNIFFLVAKHSRDKRDSQSLMNHL